MVFSSLSFIFFFLPILLVIYFISKEKYRNYILLIFSLVFYSWGEPKYILLMLFSIIINYFSAINIEKHKKYKKIILVCSIIINILLLLYFKYTNFFITNINSMFKLSLELKTITLPIGISFYTFQEISYIVDVYRKKIKPQKNIFNLGMYISFFPQLIAGPIVRYSGIQKQIKKRKCSTEKFCNGIRRFVVGFGKKVLLANNIAIIADCIFKNIANYGFVISLIGIISFTIQVYYDFSGYSDMAIGLAKMFGFDLNENFNYPYSAISISDYWRRWHISLYTWFKDYVYIPLGGNRVSKLKYIRNVFIVWILTGIWHGDSWNYIIFGLYYAIVLLIEKKLKPTLEKVPTLIRWLLTFTLINLGCFLFRENSTGKIKIVLNNLILLKKDDYLEFIWENYNILNNFIFLIIGLIFMFPLTKKWEKYSNNYKFSLLNNFLLCIIFILSICSLISNSYNPFIYFRF